MAFSVYYIDIVKFQTSGLVRKISHFVTPSVFVKNRV